MAPPPDYDREPKAPDKSATIITNEDTKFYSSLNDQQLKSDHKTSNTAANSEGEKSKGEDSVENLDDGRLRALLDEAITYKCPKDREGKSDLFKNLLEEAELDDQASEAVARASSGGGRVRRGAGRRPPLAHSNSLQDLVAAALAAEPAPRRPRPHAPVSARATHGGSLPSGVDTSFLLGEEPTRAGYLATVRCVNPPPFAERRVSASDANCPAEIELLHRSKPVFPVTYTARATLEIGSGSVSSGRAVTTTTASNQADSAIPFSCITTPEVVSSCNTTSSTSQSAVAVDPKPRSVISSSFNGLSLSRPNYGSTASTAPDEYKKSLDENGNAVQGFSSPISGSSQHKKPRRKKSSKNETVIKSHQIDGYQGNKDINEVLRFIESNAEHGRGAKLGRTKHKDDSDDKGGKKRSTERRKDKENKMKRASSLEELSRTKLEDLTDTREPQHRQDRKPRPDNKAERRSWGDDARDSFYYTERAPPAAGHDHEPTSVDVAPEPATELTDFQTVTKRRKPRRRADEPEREPPRRPRPPSPRPRRESAPPSDRSNDSNDDLDSVHSLPPPPPPPPPPAPHASYADIARTRHNIPDLIESCNFYAEEGENPGVRRTADAPAAAAAGDADGYPALGGTVRPARGKVPPRRERKERPATTTVAECPAPDVVGDRRPAVILLDSAAQPRDMDGVTFGFDINEQLLGSGARRPRCDLVRDALDAGSAAGVAGAAVAAGGGGAVAVVAGCTPLRYVPPDPPPDTHHLHQIIEYVCTAWEDVVRCGGGKVRYFSE
ncbi:unnamed protein product [Diatraea saccharalis]|uniref:Uncharacterized protein n=1 Tax=Diatraea saccharalis TaxID=40085 RepID=A0A9N9WFX2_9NEOP|nr:unnamed protein product [Diatraea saccharalis]